MKRWYSVERVVLLIKQEEFPSIYPRYVKRNIKYIQGEWLKDMRDPNTPSVTMEQFVNREIVGSVKWIRGEFAGGKGDDESQFFDLYAVDGNKEGVSIVFTPFITVDAFGNTGFNNKRVKTDLSEMEKVYYILPNRPEFSDMIGTISGKAYSAIALNQEYRKKLGDYLPDDFALEKHIGILNYTYERDLDAEEKAAEEAAEAGDKEAAE